MRSIQFMPRRSRFLGAVGAAVILAAGTAAAVQADHAGTGGASAAASVRARHDRADRHRPRLRHHRQRA
jgi:hypothetical protein